MTESEKSQKEELPKLTPLVKGFVDSLPDTSAICQDSRQREDFSCYRSIAITDVEKGFAQQQPPPAIDISRPTSVSGSAMTDVEDPNLIDWHSETDPLNPQNWKRSRKWIAIILVSAYTFMTSVGSSILAPSLESIGRDLNIENASEVSLCLSIFVLGFAFGPLLFAPLSEMYGRAVVLQYTNLLFIIFNCACGFAKTKEQLIVFRLIAGLGGSSPLALGNGVLADLFSPEERGFAVGIYAFFPILGPAVGPLCGGFIAEYSSWHWAFWATTIADVPILFLATFFLEETYSPVLLLRKKIVMQKETGNSELFTKFEVRGQTFSQRMGTALMRPVVMIATQPIIIIMGIYQAYLYGLMYIVLTTYPKLWKDAYHQSVSVAGLNYISLGLGYCVGIQACAHVQDRVYRYFKRRNDNIGVPEFRCPLMLPVAAILPAGFFIYGWAAESHTHWIWPNIGAFIFAAGIMVGFNALVTYVVDCYQTYSASAAAATTILRSLAGFLFPLFAPLLYQSLGYGWGNSVLGFLAFGIGAPAPIFLWYYGAKIRARSTFAAG